MGAAWRDLNGRKSNFSKILGYVKEIRLARQTINILVSEKLCHCSRINVFLCFKQVCNFFYLNKSVPIHLTLKEIYVCLSVPVIKLMIQVIFELIFQYSLTERLSYGLGKFNFYLDRRTRPL